MTETITPHRETLHTLTAEIAESGLDPFEGYELLQRRIGKIGLSYDTYCSSSITSGGHARDESLTMMQVIQKNTDSAFDLADELYRVGQLDASASIEAVALGKIRHWSQSDYMEFWLNVMARIPLQGNGVSVRMDTLRASFAARLTESGVDMDLYNDASIAPNERVEQYMRHADAFATVAQSVDAPPVKRLVRLIDTDQSLGAQTENYFARVMGTNVMKVAVASTGTTDMTGVDAPRRLISDTQRIIGFGGHIFDTERRKQLVLVPNDL